MMDLTQVIARCHRCCWHGCLLCLVHLWRHQETLKRDVRPAALHKKGEEPLMGHEHTITCGACGKKGQKTGESPNGRIVYVACPCGKTKYSRSKGR